MWWLDNEWTGPQRYVGFGFDFTGENSGAWENAGVRIGGAMRTKFSWKGNVYAQGT